MKTKVSKFLDKTLYVSVLLLVSVGITGLLGGLLWGVTYLFTIL